MSSHIIASFILGNKLRHFFNDVTRERIFDIKYAFKQTDVQNFIAFSSTFRIIKNITLHFNLLNYKHVNEITFMLRHPVINKTI